MFLAQAQRQEGMEPRGLEAPPLEEKKYSFSVADEKTYHHKLNEP